MTKTCFKLELKPANKLKDNRDLIHNDQQGLLLKYMYLPSFTEHIHKFVIKILIYTHKLTITSSFSIHTQKVFGGKNSTNKKVQTF
jgi:hypothetical protein